ncbi:MAG: flagellar basal body-associated FliL family protein [Alphaproteobacteria bacterium]|nr:flagellar basal body-associated FliL family protein [Alphaproteobacteria bacterium]
MSDQVFGDDFDDTADTQQRKSTGSSVGKKLALFVVLPLIALVAAGGAMWYFGVLNSIMGGTSGPEKEARKETARPAQAAKQGAAPQQQAAQTSSAPADSTAVEYVELPDMLVNLNSTDRRGRASFMKMKLVLELSNPADRAQVERMTPKIMDNVQTYLREVTPEQLRGSAGIYRLREELKVRISQATTPVQVKSVLFQELLVQ